MPVALRRRPIALDAPVVELLPELEVEERLGRDDLGQRPDAVRHVEQPPAVGADDLDEQVEAAGRDDDVVRLLPLGELVRDDLRRPRRADPDHRLGLEAEAERVRHARDLQDALLAEPAVPRAHGRLGDAERGGDPPERLAAVPLQRLDDPAVDVIELGRAGDGPAPRRRRAPRLRLALDAGLLTAAQCEEFLPKCDAMRQPQSVAGGNGQGARPEPRPRTAHPQASFTQTCLIRVYSSIE